MPSPETLAPLEPEWKTPAMNEPARTAQHDLWVSWVAHSIEGLPEPTYSNSFWYWHSGVWTRGLHTNDRVGPGLKFVGVALSVSGNASVKVRRPMDFWDMGTGAQFLMFDVRVPIELHLDGKGSTRE